MADAPDGFVRIETGADFNRARNGMRIWIKGSKVPFGTVKGRDRYGDLIILWDEEDKESRGFSFAHVASFDFRIPRARPLILI